MKEEEDKFEKSSRKQNKNKLIFGCKMGKTQLEDKLVEEQNLNNSFAETKNC